MKVRFYLLIPAFAFIACGQQKNNSAEKDGNANAAQTGSSTEGNSADNTRSNSDSETADDDSKEVKNESNNFWERLEMKEIDDGKGTVTSFMPMPVSWNFTSVNGERHITGPNGVKVSDFPLRSFMCNYNQSIQRSYDAAGQQMRQMPGIERLIQEDFVPWGNNQGFQIVKYAEIPAISKIDRWYSEQLFQAMPSRLEVAAIGIDWKSNDGKPYFMIVHINVRTSDAMQGWYYMASGLEADEAHFEAAKKQFIFSLSNMRYNLAPIMAYNQAEAQRCNQSWAAFNQRMARNQANFEASQRDFVNRSNAAHDALMSGWRQRDAASDRQQAQTIDGIYERSNVQDPTTGQKYKVAAGANQYWMNNNGEYISTKQNDYNPNLDDNMNQQKWQELKPVNE